MSEAVTAFPHTILWHIDNFTYSFAFTSTGTKENSVTHIKWGYCRFHPGH
jgi:hypothetical protein